MNMKKVSLITLEIIGLSILTIAAYYGSMPLLGEIEYVFLPYIERCLNTSIFSSLYPIAILVFDILWIATIKFWPLKNIHIKIALTLLVFAFNAAFATGLIAAYMLRDFKW